jgi:serine/threonine protein kinase
MEDKIEDTIDSKYIIKRKLGSGGTSSVFIVTEKHKNNNIEYVAKVLKDIDDEIIINQYNNEIKYLTELKQKSIPNIINIIDSGEGPIIRKDKNDGNPEIYK